MHKVFVYGSLKKGFSNHTLINNKYKITNNKFICDAVTADDNFEMISFGGFPGILRRHTEYTNRISGEIYEVDDNTLYQLDRLESNGSFYTREELYFFSTSQPSMIKHVAWVYILNDDYRNKLGVECPRISNNNYDVFNDVQEWRNI
tara:strand:- start:36 stop:476 length:441 start_codon:yes stop_codon:yes gene_type:complete